MYNATGTVKTSPNAYPTLAATMELTGNTCTLHNEVMYAIRRCQHHMKLMGSSCTSRVGMDTLPATVSPSREVSCDMNEAIH